MKFVYIYSMICAGTLFGKQWSKVLTTAISGDSEYYSDKRPRGCLVESLVLFTNYNHFS